VETGAITEQLVACVEYGVHCNVGTRNEGCNKPTRNSSGDEKPERDFYLRRHRTRTTK